VKVEMQAGRERRAQQGDQRWRMTAKPGGFSRQVRRWSIVGIIARGSSHGLASREARGFKVAGSYSSIGTFFAV